MQKPVQRFTRREFALRSVGLAAFGLPAGAAEAGPWSGPAMVKKIYIAVRRPSWPSPQLDVDQARAEAEARLDQLEQRHPGVLRFSGSEMVRTGDEAAAMAKALQKDPPDGVLVVALTSGSDGMVLAIARAGLPTLLWNQPYYGHAWGSLAAFARAGNRADVLASSEPGDLDVYARIFYAIRHVARSKVLVVVPDAERHGKEAAEFSKHFGTAFHYLTYAHLKTCYDAVDARQAAEEAEKFARGALRVVEPSREDIQRALRFHLGVRKLLAEQQANAITVDCLGGLSRGDLPGYPCVAWSLLNDAGLYGVCQADLPCTMTHLVLTALTGKPGFLFNAVFDTSRNELIQSHCVAPTAMHGLGAQRSPYIIRSHLETAAGAALQVLLPVGETVTVANFENPQRLRVSTAEVLGNVSSEYGCRTQIRTRVKDARRMMSGFHGGNAIHRVSFYGDYTDELEKMGRLMGFEIVREG